MNNKFQKNNEAHETQKINQDKEQDNPLKEYELSLNNSFWDYVIIGTGIGGSSFGLKMAMSGKKVLFLEKGHFATLKNKYAEQFKNYSLNSDQILKQAGRNVEYVQDKISGKTFRPYIGSGVGGSSLIYGMVFERFSEQEMNRSGMKWPVEYKEMIKYYQEAETLFNVKAHAVKSEANKELQKKLLEKGMDTYALPLAKKQTHGRHCSGCQGYVCDCGQKMDSLEACLNKAIHNFGATLISNCEVLKLNSNFEKIVSVDCQIKNGDKIDSIRIYSSNFVLAAGAMFTPALLLKSKNQYFPNGLANSSGLVGKNLMRHLIDIYGLWTAKKPEAYKDLKEFGAKYFFHDKSDSTNKGVLQSFGRLPEPEVIIQEMADKINSIFLKKIFFKFSIFLVPVLKFLQQRFLFVATILEDTPCEENQIIFENNQLSLKYSVTDKDNETLINFRKHIQTFIGSYFQVKLLQAHENDRIAHVCGTCRMGEDSSKSVVNKYGRSHDLKNLWIVDASIFPSSGSVNPSLTIVANALRIADKILINELNKNSVNSVRPQFHI